MKNSLLALALAAATMPLTFGQVAPPAQNQPATANPPAATTNNTKVKKHTKKSHVKKTKPAANSTAPAPAK
jgi:hypothetical protein